MDAIPKFVKMNELLHLRLIFLHSNIAGKRFKLTGTMKDFSRDKEQASNKQCKQDHYRSISPIHIKRLSFLQIEKVELSVIFNIVECDI